MILKICAAEWDNASRDKRELSVCRELGEQVMVLAKGGPADRGRVDDVDGFEVRRYSTRPLGNGCPVVVNRILSLFTWSAYARRVLKPQIISGHDLFGLLIGWMSNVGRRDKATLVYDSHEFELGRNKKRGKLQIFCVKYLERFLIKRCAFSIMVNDSIADEVQRIHKLKQRPIVVRSTPEKWVIEPSEVQKVRMEYTEVFGNKNPILMYHGVVMAGRGIERLLEVVRAIPEVNAVVLGNGAKPYLNSLKKTAEEYGITKRILFHPAVPIRELWKYVGAADIGMVTIPAVTKSYYYMLPNKFFENIHSGTPIIGSDFPEIRRLVNQYNLGLLCDPEKTDEICACVNKMLTDTEFYNMCKQSALEAKEVLCWEKEKVVLKNAYSRIIGK